MQEVEVTVNGGIISDEELQAYIARGRRNQPRNELVGITITIDGDYADIDYKYAKILETPSAVNCRIFDSMLYLSRNNIMSLR